MRHSAGTRTLEEFKSDYSFASFNSLIYLRSPLPGDGGDSSYVDVSCFLSFQESQGCANILEVV